MMELCVCVCDMPTVHDTLYIMFLPNSIGFAELYVTNSIHITFAYDANE